MQRYTLIPRSDDPFEARQNSECIYREKLIILHAKITWIQTDDQGVTVTLEDLRKPGFTGEVRPNASDVFWTVFSAWSAFTRRQQSWSATYASWSIYFHPKIIESVCSAACSGVHADLLTRYEILSAAIRNAYASDGT